MSYAIKKDYKKFFEIDDVDLVLLKEMIRYVPGYGIKYKYLTEQEQKKLIYGIVYGNVNVNWGLYGGRVLEQDQQQKTDEKKSFSRAYIDRVDLGTLLNMVKKFLFSVYLFVMKGLGVEKTKAEKEFARIMYVVKSKDKKLSMDMKKSLGAKAQYLSRVFSLVYDKVVETYENAIKEGGAVSKKTFIIRWIYKFFGGIIASYGKTTAGDPETGKSIEVKSDALRKLTGVGVLLATIIGVACIILFLLTRIPVVGRLFTFLLKILSAPFRIFWKGLGFILRKLKVIE